MLPICKVLNVSKIKTLRAEKHLWDGKSTWNYYYLHATHAPPAQRNIYATNVAYEVDYDYPHDDTSYGVGTDILEIYAHVAHTTNSPFIPHEQWM
jgi:hypothetical protein